MNRVFRTSRLRVTDLMYGLFEFLHTGIIYASILLGCDCLSGAGCGDSSVSVIRVIFCPVTLFPILLFQTHEHPCWSMGDNYLSTTPFMALYSTSSVYAPRTLPQGTVGSPTFYPFTDSLHFAYISPSYTWFCHSSETS